MLNVFHHASPCDMHGREGNMHVVEKPEGKRPLGSPRHRWNDDTEVTIEELGWQSVDWIHLAQGRDHWWAFMNTVISLVITS